MFHLVESILDTMATECVLAQTYSILTSAVRIELFLVRVASYWSHLLPLETELVATPDYTHMCVARDTPFSVKYSHIFIHDNIYLCTIKRQHHDFF